MVTAVTEFITQSLGSTKPVCFVTGLYCSPLHPNLDGQGDIQLVAAY